MNIEKAKIEYAEWMDDIIKREFPYTEFTPKKISERITSNKYTILVMRQANIDVGFAEIEWFLNDHKARLNCIFIEDAWRGQGFGRTLTEQVINECKHQKVQYLFLLVKADNIGAKHLYEELGFRFARMHDKIIDNSEVEVWDTKV